MLIGGRYALSHGAELRINWPGRLAVGPVMSSFFFAMTGLETFAEILLYIGLAMALVATAMYIRTAREQLRAGASSSA
jgi:cardiolipin synthase